MKIETIVVGLLQTNCYLVINKNNEGIIIDPGDQINKINKYTKGIDIKGIYYTHSHPDHVGALKDLELKHNIKSNDFNNNIFDMEVIDTPGHMFDSKVFYFKKEKVMFTGDFIFKGTIGRTDLYGGNFKQMKESLKNIITYPDDIKIYPGHGPSSTLGEEKEIYKSFIN